MSFLAREKKGLYLERIGKYDDELTRDAKHHYSQPKGFVGRSICYRVYFDGTYYGSIAGGSATLHLPGRNEFFGKEFQINRIVNNIFFHIEKQRGSYPRRNFTTFVLAKFRESVAEDWLTTYGDPLIGFESLVELPRTGDLYIKDGWTETGQTKGYTCKRGPGEGTDSWSGKRVWNTKDLRPKRVFCRWIGDGL